MREVTMKGFKRFMAALLAVAIMISAAPAMRTEAAGRAIKGAFYSWAKTRSITTDGQTYQTYDCSTCFVKITSGINSSDSVGEVKYIVSTLDGKKGLKSGSTTMKYTSDGTKVVEIEGGRRKQLTAVRLCVKINGKWSAWSGYIGIIPLHTPDMVKHSYNSNNNSVKISWDKIDQAHDYEVYVSTSNTGGWKLMTRTTGTSYTLKTFNGKSLQKYTNYYYKVIVRANVAGTVTRAKGDSNKWYDRGFYIYTTYK